MAWKQDLAKLKQTLGPEAPLPPVRPKAPPRPEPSRSLESEDEVFLSAMGHRAKTPRPEPEAVPEPAPAAAAPPVPTAPPPAVPAAAPKATLPPALDAPPAPAPVPETFQEALKDLKGLKPMARGPLPKPARAASPKAAPARVAPPVPPPPAEPPSAASAAAPVAEAAPAPPPMPEPAAEAPAPAQVPPAEAPLPGALPVRFQLAAGMAIEVDGLLDLRGHSLVDAQERLKDRLEDGRLLGWHSLQVTLGPDPALHDGLLALLTSGGLPQVGRYAQAPVPMGGSQAWLLYYAPSLPRPCEETRP